MCSPLEQFTLIPVLPVSLGNAVFSFSNATVFTLVTMGLVLASVKLSLGRGFCRVLPLGWQTLWECFYEFIDGMCREQLGGFRRRFITSIFAIFTLLISLNLFGLLPYSFTVTSQLSITLSFSSALFIGITLFGIRRHGLHFFSFFMPAGAPIALSPLLVLIEIVSYGFRAMTLSAARGMITAGHTLLKILSGFTWTMLGAGGVLSMLAVAPALLVLVITGLEVAVALLQAYVFSILLCVYLNDAINLH
uniref:ATP synthase subunit a n=1 Tax=Caulerpa lentillifera TaxID=148947 RepID=A0A2Z2QKD0_9CHLO|nr:ATP subunit 6 [Caulerpa lentillifera]AST24226.1 ATP subunit 6 [Caulerpa lentillifera]QKS32215.1 ATP subunit 6 [Caulerpa lentillifera]